MKNLASRAKKAKPHGNPKGAQKKDSARMRQADAALTRYEKACRVAAARGEALAAIAHRIGDVAVEKQAVHIIREMGKLQLLRDIVELRDAFAECAPGSLTPRLEALRLLPDAFLQWLEVHFRLTPLGEVGRMLELPASRLKNYTCTFDVPKDNACLLRVRVSATGWKRGDAVLVRPCVSLAEQTETVSAVARRGRDV